MPITDTLTLHIYEQKTVPIQVTQILGLVLLGHTTLCAMFPTSLLVSIWPTTENELHPPEEP